MTEKLEFNTLSLKNVTISNDSDTIYYEVRTPEWESDLTSVYKKRPGASQDFDKVADVEIANGKPAAVKFVGKESVPVDQFLKVENEKTNKIKATFVAEDGTQYTWTFQNGRLQLTRGSSDAQDQKPVAAFIPHTRYMWMLAISEMPRLEVEPATRDIMDTVIRWSQKSPKLLYAY